MVALFQGFHKDRTAVQQKILDTLQSPNGAELLCHVLASDQELWALGRALSCVADSDCWSGSLGTAVSWPVRR